MRSSINHAADYRDAERALLRAHELEARSRTVPIPSTGTVHVLDAGSGPPVVLVPGGGATAATWAPVMARLHGWHSFAVDRPGFGLTPRADLAGRSLRTVAVEFLTDVLDTLELPSAVLIGNSMGSWWTTRFAQARPQRVTGLVHIGCPALLLDTSAPLPMRVQGVRGLGRALQKTQRPSRRGARLQLRMSGDPLGRTAQDDAMADVLVAMQRMPDHDDAWLDLLHATVRPRGARPGMAIGESDLQGLAVPTHFIWGERDTFGSPSVGERAVAVLPDASMTRLRHGHVPWVSNAEEVASAVTRWLSTLSPAAPTPGQGPAS